MFFKKESVLNKLTEAQGNQKEISKILAKVPDKFFKNKDGTLDVEFAQNLMPYSRDAVLNRVLFIDKNATDNVEFMEKTVDMYPELFQLGSKSIRSNPHIILTAVKSEVFRMSLERSSLPKNEMYRAYKNSKIIPYIEKETLSDPKVIGCWRTIARDYPAFVIKNDLPLGWDRPIYELARNGTDKLGELYNAYKQQLIELHDDDDLNEIDPTREYKGKLSELDDGILDRILSDHAIRSAGICKTLKEDGELRQVFVESIALNPDNYKKLPIEFFEDANADILKEIDQAVTNSLKYMMEQSSKKGKISSWKNRDVRDVIADASEEAKAEARRVTADAEAYRKAQNETIQARAQARDVVKI